MNKTLQTTLLVTQIPLLTAILSVLLVIAGILRRGGDPIEIPGTAASPAPLPRTPVAPYEAKPYLVP